MLLLLNLLGIRRIHLHPKGHSSRWRNDDEDGCNLPLLVLPVIPWPLEGSAEDDDVFGSSIQQ